MKSNSLKAVKRFLFKIQFKLLISAMVLVLSSFGCGGQTNQNTKDNIEKNKNISIQENSQNELKKIKSHSINNSSSQRDSLSYNQYKNGKKEGLWKEFDDNNQIVSEGFYKDGKANGLMKWYYEGVLVASGNMKNDKRNGLWKICDVHNNSNCIEANFKDEKKIGIWKVLHDNGELAKEQNWKEGKMISQKCWDENGNQIECD